MGEDVGEEPLVVLVESGAVVGGERGCFVEGVVGWVEVDEIARGGRLKKVLERLYGNLGLLEGLRACAEVLFVADAGVCVAANGDVEPAQAVFAVKAVETGAVEVDDACGACGERAGRGVADGVVVVGGMLGFVAEEGADDGFDVVADGEVGCDKVWVGVREDGLAGESVEAGEFEEEGAAADERFEIGCERLGGVDAWE